MNGVVHSDREQNARLADAYDQLAYPSGVFAQTHPARLAAVARLHGLEAPPIATARVLEIGGGDGLNAMAMAAAYPRLQALSIDIAADVVRSGQALARSAGLDNVRVEVADVLDAVETMDERFDYVIAHGLYAWVPDGVRAATMALIGRVLANDGIAFVSYNAMPGGHVRLLLRDLVRQRIAGVGGLSDRADAALGVLDEFAEPRDDDSILMRGLRSQAALMARKQPGAIGHDELSDYFAPQRLADVVAAAARHGLAYLNDAANDLLDDGFPVLSGGRQLREDEVVAHIQNRDYDSLRFFRQSLFVQSGRLVARTFDPLRAAGLWLSTTSQHTGGTAFVRNAVSFDVGDERLAELVSAAASRRIALDTLAGDAERLEVVVQLMDKNLVTLHAAPLPGVADSPRPEASALARAQLARGDALVARLDHAMAEIVEPGPRAFLAMLDGSRDKTALGVAWSATSYGREIEVERALAMVAQAPLLVA